MINPTKKQITVYQAIKKIISENATGETTLPAIAEELSSSPTKIYPVLQALKKKDLVKTAWGGHSFASIKIKLP